jgi:hypothetical protein
MEITWAEAFTANNEAGSHRAMVKEYVTEKMGVGPADLVWTLETFPVSAAYEDTLGIRSETRIAKAAELIVNGEAPAILVIENPNGRMEHVDGWHRLGAAERLGLETLPAYIGRIRN